MVGVRVFRFILWFRFRFASRFFSTYFDSYIFICHLVKSRPKISSNPVYIVDDDGENWQQNWKRCTLHTKPNDSRNINILYCNERGLTNFISQWANDTEMKGGWDEDDDGAQKKVKDIWNYMKCCNKSESIECRMRGKPSQAKPMLPTA